MKICFDLNAATICESKKEDLAATSGTWIECYRAMVHYGS
jgi:hypothetical protein